MNNILSLLTSNSPIYTKKQLTTFKNNLILYNHIQNKCEICKIGNTWNNKKLELELYHINGIKNDNRLENIILLCPNCLSQQKTKQYFLSKKCAECKRNFKQSNSKIYCNYCFSKKITDPSILNN